MLNFYSEKPHFIIKRNLQKTSVTNINFADDMTPSVLSDISQKITGRTDYTVDFVENNYSDDVLRPTYNQGRLAILYYKDELSYISFSEKKIGGRNSSVQSVPTAYSNYFMNPYPKKKIYYYFLTDQGNATEYQALFYRLMSTIGFIFLNHQSMLGDEINPFTSIDDIMYARKRNASKNKSNNSTYITKNNLGVYDLYGKTYGANKYETSMMAYAMSILTPHGKTINLYEVLDNSLKELPRSTIQTLNKLGNISVIATDKTLEKREFETSNSLRSPRYVFNLLERLGNKKCFLCDCEIPELIQGAHIWPVSAIKQTPLTADEKLAHALDGNNGLWLCENHHKLFDSNLIMFNLNGELIINPSLYPKSINFINNISTYTKLPEEIITPKFIQYLKRRNQLLDNPYRD